MIKLIGAILTVTACSGIGFTLARAYEKRPKHLTSFDSALQLLQTEITYGATPITEAMNLVAQRCDPEIAELFKNTARELSRMAGITAGEAWNKSLQISWRDTALTDTDVQILGRFGASLGASDRDDQVKHLELAKSQLKIAAAQAETVAQRTSPIFKYLGFLGGLLLVLIIY